MAEQQLRLNIGTSSAGKLGVKDEPVTGITPNSATIGMSALDSAFPPGTAVTNITTPSTSPTGDDSADKHSKSTGTHSRANQKTTTASSSSAGRLIDTEAISPTAKDLAEHMSKTRQVLTAISSSFEVLNKSLQYVTAVGPAIKASEELEKSRSQLQELKEKHQAALDRLENELAARLQRAIKESLRKEALEQVKQRVRKELDTLVNKELHLRVPADLRERALDHPEKIAASQVAVHNADVRARNTCIQSASEDLHSLRLFSTSKPHPSFPKTVRVCAELPEKDIDTLLKEYNIMPPPETTIEKPQAPPSAPTKGGGGNKSQPGEGSNKPDSKVKVLTREEKINIFMVFIGVTLRVMRPTPPSTASGKEAKKPGPTVVIRGCC